MCVDGNPICQLQIQPTLALFSIWIGYKNIVNRKLKHKICDGQNERCEKHFDDDDIIYRNNLLTMISDTVVSIICQSNNNQILILKINVRIEFIEIFSEIRDCFFDG